MLWAGPARGGAQGPTAPLAWLPKMSPFCSRGIGLFIGVDLIKDTATRTPATEEANYVVSRYYFSNRVASAVSPDWEGTAVLLLPLPLCPWSIRARAGKGPPFCVPRPRLHTLIKRPGPLGGQCLAAGPQMGVGRSQPRMRAPQGLRDHEATSHSAWLPPGSCYFHGHARARGRARLGAPNGHSSQVFFGTDRSPAPCLGTGIWRTPPLPQGINEREWKSGSECKYDHLRPFLSDQMTFPG